jgi:endonuclease/exonuclease/phosphatase family metal-dependent hydrolase
MVDRSDPADPPVDRLQRVATFNIRHGLADGRHVARPWEVRASAGRLDADVAGFCEVDRRVLRTGFTDQAHLLADGFGASGSTFGTARRLGRWGSFGNLLAVRGALEDVAVVPLPDASGKERRCAVVGTAIVGELRVRVALTHLQPHTPTATAQLGVVVEALRRFDGPAVLLGDLNLRPDQVAPIVEAAGMDLAAGAATFPRHDPRARIDHVAVRGLSIIDVTVPDLEISDHRPLVVTLA